MVSESSIEFLRLAERDLLEIVEYLRVLGVEHASAFLDDLDEALAVLGKYPYIGDHMHNLALAARGYRVMAVKNCVLLYVVREDGVVEIWRVLHGTRKYGFLFESMGS